MKSLFKNLHIIFILAFLSSCGNEAPASKKGFSKAIKIKTQNISLNEIDVSLKIPAEYVSFDILEYAALVENTFENEELKQHQIKVLENLSNFPSELALYIDSTNIYNLIWVMYGQALPHIELDKETAKVAVNFMKTMALKQKSDFIKEYNFTDQKRFSSKKFSYIKLKAQQKLNSYDRYLTNYLISTKANTFMLTIVNIEDLDFQNLVNNLQIK